MSEKAKPLGPVPAGFESIGGELAIGGRTGSELAPETPCFVYSQAMIAARMVGMHAQTLRQYERIGLIEPKRSSGNIRLVEFY